MTRRDFQKCRIKNNHPGLLVFLSAFKACPIVDDYLFPAPLVNHLMAKIKTSTGLKVITSIQNKIFEIGRKVADDFKENMRIKFDEYLLQWNYTGLPDKSVVSGLINF